MSEVYQSRCNLTKLVVGQESKNNYEQIISERDEERLFFKAALPSKILVYEANLTDNTVVLYDNELFDSTNYCLDYEQLLERNIINYLHPLDKARYSHFSNRKNLISAAEDSKNYLFDDFRFFKADKKDFIWIRKTIVLIKNEINGHIKIRCFINNVKDINIQTTHTEQNKRISELKDSSIFCYEINLTKNMILWEENYRDEFLDVFMSYDNAVTELKSRAISLDDADVFLKIFSTEMLLKAYNLGQLTVSLEHKIIFNGEDIWVLTKAKLYIDAISKDIMCIMTVENIDDNKTKELLLIYKSQHDMLSDLYNKDTTEKLIDQYLIGEGTRLKHALFLFDIDDFKNVNDTFGHAFGDAIIAQTAKKLKTIFRKQDILGRIGGDEFVVLMKDIDNNDEIQDKAEEMVALIKDSYVQNGKPISITISIGVAVYSNDGCNFMELYINSDNAMYNAKKSGKNTFCLYNDSLIKRDAIFKKTDVCPAEEVKSFEDNISDFVFRILYSSSDKNEAINTVIKLVGNHFKVSRNYIFEIDHNKKTISNTFEWVKNGVIPQKYNLQDIELGDYLDNFVDGVFYLNDVNRLSDFNTKDMLKEQGIKSMLQFALYKDNMVVGFVGYDQCEFNRIPTSKEFSDLKSVANILGTFLSEMRAYQKLSTNLNVFMSLLEKQDTYNIVIDDNSHIVLAVSNKIEESNWNVNIGKCCYEVLFGSKAKCINCPLEKMRENYDGQVEVITYIKKWKTKAQIIYSWIDGEDNTKKILLTIKVLNN